MKKIAAYEVETANTRFALSIYEESENNFVGEYVGTTPKFAPYVPPGGRVPEVKNIEGLKITDSNYKHARFRCLIEMEKLDGDIVLCKKLPF